jgi:small subunit ribosomal protein S14
MAKTSSVERNNKRKKMVEQYKARRLALKKISTNKELDIEERFSAQMQLAKLPRNSSRVRVRNRCELTGRPRAYYRKFGLSRIALRDLASIGQIPGVTKSSW